MACKAIKTAEREAAKLNEAQEALVERKVKRYVNKVTAKLVKRARTQLLEKEKLAMGIQKVEVDTLRKEQEPLHKLVTLHKEEEALHNLDTLHTKKESLHKLCCEVNHKVLKAKLWKKIKSLVAKRKPAVDKEKLNIKKLKRNVRGATKKWTLDTQRDEFALLDEIVRGNSRKSEYNSPIGVEKIEAPGTVERAHLI